MSQPPDSPQRRRLLPADWYSAPKRHWQIDRYGTFTFVWTNLLLGTLGLWAPIVGAFLTRQSISRVAGDMLASGSLYLFVIPFVASIACSVFTAAHSDESNKRPWRLLDVLKVVVMLVCLVCLFLMPYQVLANELTKVRNGWLQVVACMFATTIGIYVFCLLKLDVEEPFADLVDRRAKQLIKDAEHATSHAGDFE